MQVSLSHGCSYCACARFTTIKSKATSPGASKGLTINGHLYDSYLRQMLFFLITFAAVPILFI
jgi:hypothetical protein